MKTMLTTFAIFGVLSAGVSQAHADLQFDNAYSLSTDPLTTESVWSIDPGELNPHRRRWILKRVVDLKGLSSVKKGDAYGVEATQVQANTVGYVRASGPYFQEMSQFPCTSVNTEVFATEDGTRYALQLASKNWEELLSRERLKLEVKLHTVRGEFPEVALKNGKAVFESWLSDINDQWRAHGEKDARAEESKYYAEEAKKLHVCSKSSKVLAKNWRALMDPPQGPEKLGQVLSIAPARRWSGLYTVRVSIRVAEKELLGKFLIDSDAPTSVISPVFLLGQGVAPSWMEVPKALPQKIFWSGGGGVGKPGDAAEVKISGFSIPLHRFIIHETDFFGPPDSFASCCDGILGADFLRMYSVQFNPGPPTEVRLYPREGFQYAPETPWTEASIDAKGAVISECTMSPEPAKAGTAPSVEEMKWATGSENAIEVIPSRWAELEKKSRHWNLSCNGTTVAKSVEVSAAEQESSNETLAMEEDSLSARRDRKQTGIGMEILGRGPFTLDLGHGRIWFAKKGLDSPIVQNRSGLSLEYQFQDGERVLRVSGIRKNSGAQELTHAGIHVGMFISSVDSKGIEEMDQWEIDQRLSGVYGASVELEWHPTKKTQKTVSLKVR